jgi:hypothetical protein
MNKRAGYFSESPPVFNKFLIRIEEQKLYFLGFYLSSSMEILCFSMVQYALMMSSIWLLFLPLVICAVDNIMLDFSSRRRRRFITEMIAKSLEWCVLIYSIQQQANSVGIAFAGKSVANLKETVWSRECLKAKMLINFKKSHNLFACFISLCGEKWMKVS